MKYNLEKIIKLIQKTKDKCIFWDSKTNTNFVIMPINEYERLINAHSNVKDLTQDELLDKINRDIAIWKVRQEDESPEWPDHDFAERIRLENEESESENEDKFYLEPLEP